MRILHVISGIDPANGGTVTALHGLTKAQAKAGMEVSIAATWHQATGMPSAERFESAGVKVQQLGPATGALSTHPDLSRFLDELIPQFDIVHIHAMWEQIQYLSARIAGRRSVPYVITPHGMLDRWNMSRGAIKKRLVLRWRLQKNLNKASLIHFTSEFERDQVARFNFTAPQIVEPLGINVEEFSTLPPAGTFRRRFPQLKDRPYVLFLGRIHPGKGVEYLIPALAKMTRADVMLVISGPDSGGFKRTVDGMIAQVPGLVERIVFTGMISGEDRLAALVDAELLAAPSFHENFGMAVAEALAVGRPVVVSDQVGLHTDVANERVGGVVPLDVRALARELDRWLSDDVLRSDASQRARELIRARYDWSSIALRWKSHYTRLLESK